MYTSKKLLALSVGTGYSYFFNTSGYYYYDGDDCSWMTGCDFECEIYNYDSRFLDYLGIWTIT